VKGWQRERDIRRAAAAARAAGGTIVGQPKIIARLLVAIMSDGTAKVAMPGDLDAQWALIGRAITATIIQASQQPPQEEAPQVPALEGVPVEGEVVSE
jgi:hypothetical protein